MLTEVINYYKNNGSSVYMGMLDASKAFDRVNLLTLFKLFYLSLLMKIGEKQEMRIRWNKAVTDYFSISKGLKQGGMLSPVLFSL